MSWRKFQFDEHAIDCAHESFTYGIGVFALADIPAGITDLFSPAEEWPGVPRTSLDALPAHARKLVDTYCLKDDDMVYLPPRGFQVVDLVLFLNHSDTPNLCQMDGGNYFLTLRSIDSGEELTVDYNLLTTESAPTV